MFIKSIINTIKVDKIKQPTWYRVPDYWISNFRLHHVFISLENIIRLTIVRNLSLNVMLSERIKLYYIPISIHGHMSAAIV
jgi:hypothetical protein